MKPINNSYWTDARLPHLSTEFNKTPDARTSSFTVGTPPLTIGQRLQQLAMSADRVTALPTLRGIPPLAYPGREGMDQNQAYSMAGSTHSIPTSAPGMYDYTNVQGTQSTSSNSLLESHMSQLSRTMLQLAQTNQVIANHQQQNHQAMVDVQKQKMDAFNALAAATEQRKYDNFVHSNSKV